MRITSQNLYLYVPPSLHQDCDQPLSLHHGVHSSGPIKIIFLVTGNPGLIGYYHTFLNLLSQSEEGRGCVVYGASLGGFEVVDPSCGMVRRRKESEGREDVESEDAMLMSGDEEMEEVLDMNVLRLDCGLRWPRNSGLYRRKHACNGLYDLTLQVEFAMTRLDGLVRWLKRRTWADEQGDEVEVEVTLMGHSVGAWIVLEMRRKWWERYRSTDTEAKYDANEQGGSGHQDEKRAGANADIRGFNSNAPYNIANAVLLTPTIMDLAKSPSGRIATPLLTNLGFLPSVLQSLNSLLRSSIPDSWFRSLVSKMTGQVEGEGLETTLQFLKSDKGVKQALYLARDELKTITDDRWSDEVWLTGETSFDASQRDHGMRMFFLFAAEDHWVAQTTKEEIIRLRGGEKGMRMGRTVVVDDKDGLVHAWCLKQSEAVSRIVREWLREARRDND